MFLYNLFRLFVIFIAVYQNAYNTFFAESWDKNIFFIL